MGAEDVTSSISYGEALTQAEIDALRISELANPTGTGTGTPVDSIQITSRPYQVEQTSATAAKSINPLYLAGGVFAFAVLMMAIGGRR